VNNLWAGRRKHISFADEGMRCDRAADIVPSQPLSEMLDTGLANNGGPTQTRALVVGSPAVDAVSAATCPPPESDQRGVTRPQNTTCDMGAFELEFAQPGTVQFSAASFSVTEAGGNAIITVTRTDGSTGAISVGYTTATGGTATEGADYTFTSGFLDWAEGDTASKTFNVPIINDTDVEGNETLNLTLRNPDGGGRRWAHPIRRC
jgi:hypothetical protein